MKEIDTVKIPNPATQLIIIRRYMHVLALLQNSGDNVQWNAASIADLLSLEEDSDAGLSDKIIRTYIKQFLIDQLGVDIETRKGSRHTRLAEPIDPDVLERIASVYLSFTATDSSREMVLKRLIEKHPDTCLWMLGRIHFAILEKKKITFSYTKHLAPQNQPKNYLLHPYHIVLRNNNLYLVGRSGRSGHTVLFILNKIDNLAVTDDTYPEDVESAAEYFKDSLGSYIGKKFRAKLRIERVYFRQVDEIISSLDPEYTEDEGGQTVTAVFDVSDDTYLCKQIFPFGRNVEIIEPRELRETMVNLLKEGIAMYS